MSMKRTDATDLQHSSQIGLCGAWSFDFDIELRRPTVVAILLQVCRVNLPWALTDQHTFPGIEFVEQGLFGLSVHQRV